MLLLPTYVMFWALSLVSRNPLSNSTFNYHNFHLRTYHQVPSAELRHLFVPSLCSLKPTLTLQVIRSSLPESYGPRLFKPGLAQFFTVPYHSNLQIPPPSTTSSTSTLFTLLGYLLLSKRLWSQLAVFTIVHIFMAAPQYPSTSDLSTIDRHHWYPTCTAFWEADLLETCETIVGCSESLLA